MAFVLLASSFNLWPAIGGSLRRLWALSSVRPVCRFGVSAYILSPYRYPYRFRMKFCPLRGIFHYQSEVASASGAWHFPGKDTVHCGIFFNRILDIAAVLAPVAYVGRTEHPGEHCCLRLERGFVGGGEGRQVVTTRDENFLVWHIVI